MNLLTPAVVIALAAPALALAHTMLVPLMPDAVSGPKNDYNLSVSDDGHAMVFARSEADFTHAKIMLSERDADTGSDWPAPQPIAFSDDRYRDSDPWLTPDGNTLYFVSDRPTASRVDRHDLDLWRSVRRDGRWQPPEHLGDTVNGRGEELGPELHDGVLYFATAKKSGLGGLDVYAAKATADGFAKPELLPAPINSASSESDFTLSCDGATALFWRQVSDRGLLHVSRRSADGTWSAPTPLPDAINIGPFNFTPAFNRDGTRITFASTRVRDGQVAGMADVFEATVPDADADADAEARAPAASTREDATRGGRTSR